MKLIETTDDYKTVRLGIVKLGMAVGKMKYSLIDEVDIPIINEYKFDARLEIDRNGDGLRVIAMGHPKGKGATPIPLQKILWENRHGPVEQGYEVMHLNGISMDNRMDNLTLVPTWISKQEQEQILRSRCSEANVWEPRPLQQHNNNMNNQHFHIQARHQSNNNEGTDEDHFQLRGEENKSQQRKGENSLYWKAIMQLLINETEEQKNVAKAPCTRAYFSTNGELISRDCPSFYFFECHYPPCTAIESEPREFAMCGRCAQARYCGRDCQRDDWNVNVHRDNCFEPAKKNSGRSSKSIRRDLMDR